MFRQFFRRFNIEPLLFLYAICVTLTNVVEYQMYVTKVCILHEPSGTVSTDKVLIESLNRTVLNDTVNNVTDIIVTTVSYNTENNGIGKNDGNVTEKELERESKKDNDSIGDEKNASNGRTTVKNDIATKKFYKFEKNKSKENKFEENKSEKNKFDKTNENSMEDYYDDSEIPPPLALPLNAETTIVEQDILLCSWTYNKTFYHLKDEVICFFIFF